MDAGRQDGSWISLSSGTDVVAEDCVGWLSRNMDEQLRAGRDQTLSAPAGLPPPRVV